MSPDEKTELWQLRMREISGAIAVSAIFQLVIGFTGFVGKLLKIITPLTIVPTVSLVGLTLFQHAGETAAKHWGIAVRYFKWPDLLCFIAPVYGTSNYI